jgi:DNA-binding response OmpR family regulator
MSERKKTIFLIDDEASVRRAIRKNLRSLNHRILEAENCEQAMAIVKDGHPQVDMLLIDISLPGKNGFMIAEALREIYPNLKMLFMSAPVGAEWTRYQGVPVTDVHFLPKPFGAAELLERVQYVLAWRAPLSAGGAGSAF